jgi:mono/diheme cytochrome c family protein
MSLFRHRVRCLSAGLLAVGVAVFAVNAAENEATFYRAINLNGPPLTVDGYAWEGGDAPHLGVNGKAFENQSVPLKPATDVARATMIRSSRWGSSVDVELTSVPAGDYQVFLYVWEDNHSEQFDLLVNGRTVLDKFHSGSAGSWRKLGPWPASVTGGKLTVSARGPGHGAANLSGIEVWAGAGPLPAILTPTFAIAPTPEQLDFFERRIRPVLAEHCYECHSATAAKLKGGLLLDSRSGMVKGGDTGPAITPGQPDASLLIQAVRHTDPNLIMPPKTRLTPEAVADLEAWVRQGAPDPRTEDTVASTRAKSAVDWTRAREWWAFRPLTSPAPPSVLDPGWPAGPLDRFILARIEEAGLTPVAEADRRSLLRRATFDLTGLPPTPEEVQAFLDDPSPDAFRMAVERLLDSPQYGERWGRHWLDVIRYADTAGDNSDFPIPQMYRYRNWVIAAFNRDLPYDQFVREQLAGDLLSATPPEEHFPQVIATGYLANARRFGSRVADYPQHLTIEDTLDNLGRTFLGLTINCARCHDHKFDPITTEDYYALYGIFHSTRYPWPGIELEQRQRDLVPLVEPSRLAEAEAARAARDAEQRRLQKEVQRLKDSLKETPKQAKAGVEARIQEAEQAARAQALQPLPFELAYAVADATRIENVPVQVKGDPAKPGTMVPRRFLTVLGGAALAPGDTTSGRRQLADWIADPANPLTARVMVNRIWQHHFGRGLVPTPNDFGRQGKPPTHPALLDWLASRFIESGWSVKSMHRLILNSRTWRQSSQRSAAAREKDPGDELLAGYPRRRLDAEALRDTLLLLGGTLDRTAGAEHPFPPQTEWKFTQHNPFKAVYETPRRSVYLMTQRIQRHPFLATFDGPDPAASTPARLTSTTPVQALFLLNDPLVHAQANRFADQIRTSEDTDAARIRRAYDLAFGRPAEPDDVASAQEYLASVSDRLRGTGTPPERVESEAWQSLVRVLFRLNEFVYLD